MRFFSLKKFILRQKLTAGVIALIIVGGGYFGYTKIFNKSDEVRYVVTEAKKDTLIVSLSGSGQVSALSQVEIKPKAAGEIASVYVVQGQEVGTGALLAIIDPGDANRAVRDAETSLETAKLERDKVLEPLDELTLLQAENSLTQTKDSKQKAEDDLKKDYDDGLNIVANAFLDLPTVMAGLYDILFSSTLGGGGQWNLDYYTNAVQAYDEKSVQYKESTRAAYEKARASYDKNFADYKLVSRFSDRAAIELLTRETYDTTKDIAEAIKSANNLIQFYKDKLTEHSLKSHALADTHLSSLSVYTGKTNSNLSSLLSITRSIQDSKDAIVSAERSIEEKKLSLAKVKKGPEDLDIRARKVVVQQKEDVLLTAKELLADHYVRAPFGGVVAKIDAKKGDSASAGTVLAILATKQKIAEISLNEVDVAKVKMGQKATLTFDAVPDLTLTGQVAEVDTVGTISQGVVTYAIKIAFDTQDERVKSSMSVSASIVIEVKTSVLLISASAVKSQQNAHYVEVVEGGDLSRVSTAANGSGIILKNTPRKQAVETGLSNDELTEVVSGLKEGDHVVARTIQPSTVQTQTTQQSGGLRIPGLPGGGGGGFRGGGGR